MTSRMDLVALLALGVILWISSASGDIRCYCNDASCVSTGYMCKSAIGRCFSHLSYSTSDSTRSAHGCVETLPPRDRNFCQSEGDLIKAKNGPDEEWPLLMCCKEDMCNYQESLDINIYVDTKANGSILKGQKSNSRGNPVHQGGSDGAESRGRPGGDSYWSPDQRGADGGAAISQRDLWFKAAVIAVPIAGGFILILLVLLAVRMLRTDSRRHRHLMHIRHQRSLTKAQLYVADHFYHNETDCLKSGSPHGSACSGSSSSHSGCVSHASHGTSSHLVAPVDTSTVQDLSCRQLHQQPPQQQLNSNVYKDVSVKLDKNGYEKMRPWSESGSTTSNTTHEEAPGPGGSVNSVVLWNGCDPPGIARPILTGATNV